MTKLVISLVLLVFLLFIVSQIYVFWGRRNALRTDYGEMERALQEATRIRDIFGEELDYLARPENLEKELRARFNYRAPGEKTLILVPGSTSTATST